MSMFDGMTVRDCHEKHKELWTWLSKNPGKEKMEWPGWMEFEDFDIDEVEEISECFGCLVKDAFCVDCSGCLISWPEEGRCGDNRSLYSRWASLNSDNMEDEEDEDIYDEVSRIAEVISNLPFNPYWEDKMNWVIDMEE